MSTELHREFVISSGANADYGLVSIIMPLYNSSDYIKATIDSVIEQTYKNWELIIVDDCSTDNSLRIVQQYDDIRIRLIKNTVNSGAAVSRNNAIKAAKGRWIAFLDSDDLWEKDKLLQHIGFMLKENTPFSFTGYNVLNSENKIIAVFEPSKDIYKYSMILRHNYIGCSTVIYDANVLGKVYMPVEAIKREDQACWLRILKNGVDAVCFHERLTTYRVYNSSVSSNKFKMVKYQWDVYRKVERLPLIKSVFCMMCWAVLGVLKYR